MSNFKFLGQAIFICIASTVLVACGGDDTATPTEAFKMPEADMAALNAMSTMELLEAAANESNKLADVLATVNDEASARAAATEMHMLESMLNAVGKGLGNLDGNGMALSTSILKPMQAFAEAQARIFNEAGRIATDHPELQDIIAEGLENIDSGFQ